MIRSFFRLPRTVIVLGAVSFMNDVASEMVMPLLPIFLVSALGAGPAVLGLIEGVADATASLLKLVAGMAADRTGRWRRFVRTGYAVSNAARPLIGLAGSWSGVLGLRFTDRLGKGVRSAPRDAMIAASVPMDQRGKAFGFHRAMDHAGASLGPVLAFVLLTLGLSVSNIILLSAIPGVLVIAIVWMGLSGLPEGEASRETMRSWSSLSPDFRRLVVAAGGVAFASVPDVLLIFWIFQSGIELEWVPLLWAIAHIGRMGSVAISGPLSDHYGRSAVMISGWVLRVVVLLALALVPWTKEWVWLIFLLYTAVTAWTESVERAWISDLAPTGLRATLFGAFHMATGLAVLPGAVLIGIIWEMYDAPAAFLVSAILTAFFAFYLFRSAGRIGMGEPVPGRP